MSTCERLICCTDFQHAMQQGTDKEGHCPLIDVEKDRYVVGYRLPAINYCPWCGKNLEEM